MGRQRLDHLARRILRVLQGQGPRKANVLAGLRRHDGSYFPRHAFEASIGQLFIAGYIKPVGKTNAKKIGLNGRRSS